MFPRPRDHGKRSSSWRGTKRGRSSFSLTSVSSRSQERHMPSPFPGMDPFLETNPVFQELHTQMLAEMQALLQPQLRPKYVARLERHLSEGSVWDAPPGAISLARKEPDVTVVTRTSGRKRSGSTAVLARPAVSVGEELDSDELELRKQRRIVI